MLNKVLKKGRIFFMTNLVLFVSVSPVLYQIMRLQNVYIYIQCMTINYC